MSRSTDTRERTRAVANALLAQGYAPSEVTVDRIYGEIRQGSRTTIHDELRLWRSEQRQQHQVVRDAPEAVRLALQTLWSGAVTEAGQQWAGERDALQLTLAERDAQLDALQLTLAEQQQALDAAEQRVAAALAESQQWQARHQHLTQEREREHDASLREQAVAQAQIASLTDTLAAVRHDAQAQSAAAEQRLRETVSELRAEAAAQATAQQAMLDTATHRLESVQRSMLLQLEQTRSEQRDAQASATRESTARQQAEEAMRQAQALAEAANRAQTQAERERARQAQLAEEQQASLNRLHQTLAQAQAQRELLEGRASDRDALLIVWQDRARQAEQHLAQALQSRHDAPTTNPATNPAADPTTDPAHTADERQDSTRAQE